MITIDLIREASNTDITTNITTLGEYAILGKLVSNKCSDVMKMCECFNIQVSNPMTILNQDTSRNFLNSKNPADKYKVFFLTSLGFH